MGQALRSAGLHTLQHVSYMHPSMPPTINAAPVQAHVGEQLVLAKGAIWHPTAVTPCPELFEDPSRKAYRRVVKGIRQGLRFCALDFCIGTLMSPEETKVLQE